MAAEKVWPNIKLLMCYAHVRRAVRRRFAAIDAYDNPVYESLLKDLHQLHLYAVDQEAFCLLYGLFQRKWVEDASYPLTSGHHGDQRMSELLRDGFKYLSSTWLIGSNGQRVRNWYQGANITRAITNNSLEVHNRVFKDNFTYRRQLTVPHLLDKIGHYNAEDRRPGQ